LGQKFARTILGMFKTEFLDLPPLEGASGTVRLPGSKSISNRVLLLAALCGGETLIHDLLDSDDTRVMVDALRALGCGVRVDGQTHRVTGLGAGWMARSHPPISLFLGNAGTAMRPLAATLAICGVPSHLHGVARMHERPIGDLADALLGLGCDVRYAGNAGFPPLNIGPAALDLSRPLSVRGDVSSQFLTSLLMALPMLSAHQGAPDIHIDVVGELISKPYIEITLALMARFGVEVQRVGWQRFSIRAGSRYVSPGEIHVEADASSASYFVALGAMFTLGSGPKSLENSDAGALRIEGVGLESIQGDIRFVQAAQTMGAQVGGGANWLEVSRGAWPLKAIDLDCNHIPDAAMTLAVMALFADGPSRLRNIASWRVKETDRIAAMACELRKLGAQVVEGADFIEVWPLANGAWQAASIHTYDDHRVAMCFSLAAFNPDGVAVRIEDPKCVAKTFPDYFEALFSVAKTEAARIPVICIDGPTASGKGTLAALVAQKLGYHYLDSGALYRTAAVAAQLAGLDLDDAQAAAQVAARMNLEFQGQSVLLNGADVSDRIRTEAAGMAASKVSAYPAVRQALHDLQLSCRKLPGLVADGRDMGSVVFPGADLKVFLTSSAEIRAERRHKQLISKGISAKMEGLLVDLKARDERDSRREVAPLKPTQDALVLDNSELTIDQSVEQVLSWWRKASPFPQSPKL
jgi:3-phosphoshikimate 1-carboxyvinyltransferase